MTTGRPESDPYGDDHGRNPRPAVPGWSAGQDYTGPLFDDTGWHIDLSDVDWGDSGEHDWADDRADGANATFRFENQDHQRWNGGGPATADYDRTVKPPGRTDQGSGRHARRARPPGAARRIPGQPPPRTQPRRVVPSGYHQPPATEPRPDQPRPYEPRPYHAEGYQTPPAPPPPEHPP